MPEDFADLASAVDDLFPVYQREPTALTRLQQAVLDTWVLSGVVGNGGFEAWLQSNGHRAVETINGLRLLGQEAVADVVAAALLIAGDFDHLSEKVWAADDALEQAMARAVRSQAWGEP